MITEGSRVRFNKELALEDRLLLKRRVIVAPPKGTLGTVLMFSDHPDKVTVLVRWDKGTSCDGEWWCDYADIDEVIGDDANEPQTTNPVEKAYKVLTGVFNSKKCTKAEAMIAIEEAVGYLGEVLAE